MCEVHQFYAQVIRTLGPKRWAFEKTETCFLYPTKNSMLICRTRAVTASGWGQAPPYYAKPQYPQYGAGENRDLV
jgi:hypothetical protein